MKENMLDSEEFMLWKTDPRTIQVLRYLSDFADSLVDTHKAAFIDSHQPTEEDFIRDSERYQTLKDLINLDYEDIEVFYETTTSMGKADSPSDEH